MGGEARAGNGTRTRDPNLGKVVLYQLSYSRMRSQGGRSGMPGNAKGLARGPDEPTTLTAGRRTGVETRGIEPLTS